MQRQLHCPKHSFGAQCWPEFLLFVDFSVWSGLNSFEINLNAQK
jgi:hypothetical protein